MFDPHRLLPPRRSFARASSCAVYVAELQTDGDALLHQELKLPHLQSSPQIQL
jgi:hypothetical protein